MSSSLDASQRLPTQIESYLVVSTATVWLWDLLLASDEEIQTFSGRHFSLYDFAYFTARVATGGFLLCPIGSLGFEENSCLHMLLAVEWFEAFALISNSSLFLFRLLAVFNNSWKMKAAFSFLWMSSFMALVTPASISFIRIVPKCEFSEVTPVALICFIVVTGFDTLVFVAVSIQILRFNREFIERTSLLSLIFGKGLGHVSKVVLRSEQAYYLTTVCANILALVALLSSKELFSPVLRTAFTLASMALQNIMGCKTFRLLRIRVLQYDVSTQAESSVQFATQNTTGSLSSPTTAEVDGDGGNNPGTVGFTLPINICV
ncbi:hypothetical protein QCA50_011263 [Cerrena zonata]|uniref:Uncharacterized protein n=1 Tax=Cerrena zonata TaxID=2478898 RepID=A0AAW0G2Q0_9APHY